MSQERGLSGGAPGARRRLDIRSRREVANVSARLILANAWSQPVRTLQSPYAEYIIAARAALASPSGRT